MQYLAVITLVTLASTLSAGPRLVDSSNVGATYLGAVVDMDWGRPLTSGDFDGDGFDELVIAASESFGSVMSAVYVIRGGPGVHGAGQVDLAVTPADLVITGAQIDDNLGASLAAGDVNGDTVDDLIAVASTADLDGVADRGIAYVLFGGADFFQSSTRHLSNTDDWDIRIVGPVAGGDMGGALLFGGSDAEGVAVGNLNGDAFGDIVLGVHLADGVRDAAGRAYILFGRNFIPGRTYYLSTSSGYDVRVFGKSELDELGTVVKVGDITGDGIDELILPTAYASQGLFTSEGAVFIFRGRTDWPGTLDLFNTPADFTILGDREYDNLGDSAAIGDFNGDTIPDLAAAAPGADAGAFNNQRGDGIIYAFLGGSQYQTGTITIDLATASADFTFIGEFEENLGTLVSAGDYDGDGFDDIAASERFAGPSTNGVVEVLFGRSFTPGASFTASVDTDIRVVGAPLARIGFSLTTANVNGDALDEIVFGTPFNNNDAGTIYVHTHVSGDADADGDVDLADWHLLEPCAGTIFTSPPTLPCAAIDFTLDEAIDASDIPVFVGVLNGPGAE